MTQFSLRMVLLAASLIPSGHAVALPIGFGYNQGTIDFMELKNEDFTVYHDKRAPEDAKLILRSLNAAKPNLENWFAIKRKSPLVINVSAASDNASFANFVTDSIEIQTLGQGGRDLAWHEFTHSMMYQHLDNLFGPAGAIIHLPWMEAWFLEGLAESVSVSLGSDEQASVERYHALTDNWPSWDRIHSLYTSGPFNYRGYAASGAFVAWILRTHDANKLPAMLQHFRSKSMPWYWPWALTPMNGFLPMDESLKTLTGKSGRELYEQYKMEATSYWRSKIKGPLLASQFKKSELTTNAWAWDFHDKKLIKKLSSHEVVGAQETKAKDSKAWIGQYNPRANQRSYNVSLSVKGKKPRTINRDSTWIEGPWISYDDVWWLETKFQSTSLCKAPIAKFKLNDVKCILTTTMPQHLRYLGHKQDTGTLDTAVLWLVRDTEDLQGDDHEILEVQLATGIHRSIKSTVNGRPVSMAGIADQKWILVGDRSVRHLVQMNSDDSCVGMVEMSDFPIRIVSSEKDRPYVIIYTADGFGAAVPIETDFPLTPCRTLSKRSSPMLEAVRSQKPISFKEAVAAASIWSNDSAPVVVKSTANAQEVAPGLKESNFESTKHSDEKNSSELVSKPSKWRGRPVFAFPWIGADDALGPQIGIISVPLMDEMQNETVRLTALIGAVSRFPYQDLTITTNRFAPTWSLTAFRAQTYNGRYRTKSTGNIYSAYLEESGSHIDGYYGQWWRHLNVDWAWGIKSSHLKPYIGPARRTGHLNETYAGVSIAGTNGGKLYANSSLKARIASPSMNKVYQYDVVGVAAASGAYVGDGKFELGLETSRTRGPKRRDLQEMYSPLKTLIPGSGAGYNQTNYALSDDYGLFSPVFGENQARARITATHPIIKDIDKFKGILYIDRLDFSGFLNYGTAWRGEDLPETKSLIAAQGYSADLFMDNKGVHFNMGLGVGQVLGKPWQGYWTFGFDALF